MSSSLLFMLLLILLPSHAAAQEMAAEPEFVSARPLTMTPGEVTSGALLFHAVEDGRYIQAPLEASDVKIEVTGLSARTKVTQSFYNPTEGWLEGIYVFPMPEDAAVDTLKMQIGDRFIEGEIKERQEAKRIYDAAKAEGKKASLLEQERPNIFTNSVANIGPGELVVIQIEYQQGLKIDKGEVRLRFPMVVAPRFNPPAEIQMVSLGNDGFGTGQNPVPDRDRITPPVIDPATVPEGTVINPVTLDITLRAGFPVDKIISPFHAIDQQRIDNQTTLIKLAAETIPANRDFELVWKAKQGKAPTAALFREHYNGEDYIYALLTPPVSLDTVTVRPREVVFVIDNSGSMGGTSIRQAKESLLLALGRLQNTDRFNVIRFDDTMETVFPSPVTADSENIGVARRFVAGLEARGGTMMLPALKAALVDPAANDTHFLRQVVFLTDGAIGNEDELFREIGKNLGRSRLFTVGIGSAPNSHFMDRASRIGRGTFTYIGDLAQVSARMGELFGKLETPVMTDLQASFPQKINAEAWPNPLPDLYSGEPVLLTARLSEAKGKLVIDGLFNGKRWAVGLDMKDAKPGSGIAKIWARRKIASLEQSRFDGRSHEEIESGVLKTALNYGLVSRLTSLVAVDVTRSRPEDSILNSAEVPVNFPDGWDFETVFGKSMAPVRTLRAQGAPRMDAYAEAMVSDAAAPAAQGMQGARLPQGATSMTMQRLIGLILVVLSSALIFIRRRKVLT